MACVSLSFNNGHLKVTPGMVIVLGPDDIASGIHIDSLLENGGIVPYESDQQCDAIRSQWEKVDQLRRETLRASNIRRARYG